MIFMNLRNFVDHISFVISSDWNFVRAFFDLCQVQVRPLVMGVTEVGRDSSHVLMSMGFREVDNVLTNAVLTGTGAQQFWFFFHGFFAQVQLLEASKSPTELCTFPRSTCHERCEGKPHDWKSSQRGELLGFEESKGIPISVFFVVKNLQLGFLELSDFWDLRSSELNERGKSDWPFEDSTMGMSILSRLGITEVYTQKKPERIIFLTFHWFKGRKIRKECSCHTASCKTNQLVLSVAFSDRSMKTMHLFLEFASKRKAHMYISHSANGDMAK